MENTAFIIVDMQNYYLKKESDFIKFSMTFDPFSCNYLLDRVNEKVIPNIKRIKDFFKQMNSKVVYLRLCGLKEDRSDLHYFFREFQKQGEVAGFDNIYPVESDKMSEIVDEIKPVDSDIVINKTTFSPFTFTDIDKQLKSHKIKTLVFSGLATSQCVETTARDASERGYRVVFIEDALVDYDQVTHNASLHASMGVCGGMIYSTDDFFKIFVK